MSYIVIARSADFQEIGPQYGESSDGVEFGDTVSDNASYATVTIQTGSTLPSATQNVAYSVQLVATGGDGTYAWSLVSGTLPAGITLSGGGLLSGTPTTLQTANFTIRADDQAGATQDKAFSLEVLAASLLWFELNPDSFTDIQEVEALPGVRLSGDPRHTLTTGLTTPWGGTKAFRQNLLAIDSRPDMGSGIEVIRQDSGTVQASRIWIEMYIRFGPTWTVEGVEIPEGRTTYTSSHKVLLMYDQMYSEGWRWEDFHGVFSDTGQHIAMISGGTKAIYRANMDIEFNGNWHKYRYDCHMDHTGWGRYILDINDGQKVFGWDENYTGAGADTPIGASAPGPGLYFHELQFGANNNRGCVFDLDANGDKIPGTGVDMWFEYGRIRVYRSDPGWNLALP